MRARPPLSLVLALAVAVPLAAAGDGPPRPPPRLPEVFAAEAPDQPVFEVLPMHRAVREVARRFEGRIIAATLLPPRGSELERGVELVYGFRLMTPRRDVIEIRMDARTGRFLDIRGNDIAGARRRK